VVDEGEIAAIQAAHIAIIHAICMVLESRFVGRLP
jgi:hypothetical protein